MTHTVLVIDDDRSVVVLVKHALQPLAVEIVSALSPQEGLKLVAEMSLDVILLDVKMPRMSGIEVLRQIRETNRRIPIILFTAGTHSNTAIEAMQSGAFDFITKPLEAERLREVVRRALEVQRQASVPVAVAVEEQDHRQEPSGLFVGRSRPMLEVFKEIGRVAGQNVTVLIRGESGTGKELAARAIYQFSDRANRPFMAVNCAALSDTLLESELFGHERGAFTGAERRHNGKFEQASGGTLFLDEVGDMSPLTQGKVLRVLQERQFERVGGNTTIETDVRLIAATNRPLEEMVESGEFRSDLFFRLNIVTIVLPPLRERMEDIPMLLQSFLTRYRQELNKPEIEGISPDALAILQQYSWPGNVRELQSVVRQFVLKARSQVIVPDDLPVHLCENVLTIRRVQDPTGDDPASIFETSEPPVPVADSGIFRSSLPSVDVKRFIEERLAAGSENLNEECIELIERYLYARVIDEFGGNQSKAARVLGVTRGKVRDRIAAFRIVVGKNVTVGAVDLPITGEDLLPERRSTGPSPSA